jgi:hypothetical protein
MDVDAPAAAARPPLAAAAAAAAAASSAELCGCSDEARFVMELEMVQCLANPHYLNC